jgi:hypothetical protein
MPTLPKPAAPPVPGSPATIRSPGRQAFPQAGVYPENQCAGAGLVLW